MWRHNVLVGLTYSKLSGGLLLNQFGNRGKISKVLQQSGVAC